MKYITATIKMVDVIYNILQTTIKTVYPRYYPKEVVDFFCNHHNKEHILDGITSGNMGVLKTANLIIGTGCYNQNHITGLYVLPDYQKQGYGSYIMKCLETEIMKKLAKEESCVIIGRCADFALKKEKNTTLLIYKK